MDSIRTLKLFVAAYEERSFSSAALREGATQSGVSQHIRSIEQRTGSPLFTRTNGRVLPTPAGDAYYRRCISILSIHERALSELKSFGKELEGEINVGLMYTLTNGVLAPALNRFYRAYPNVRVNIVETNSVVLTERILSGHLEFAIVPETNKIQSIHAEKFGTSPECFVSAGQGSASTDMPPHLKPIRLQSLTSLRLVLPSSHNVRRQTIDAYLAAHSVDVGFIVDLDAMLGVIDLVSTSDFSSILPGVMIYRELKGNKFRINAIIDPVLTVTLDTIQLTRKPMSAAAAIFHGFLQEEFEKACDVLKKHLRG